MWSLLIGIAMLVAGCRSVPRSTAAATPVSTTLAVNATVTHIVDGDTIDVEIAGKRERVRLIGIDTPETKKPNTPVQCYGPEATAFTTSLLPIGAALHLERDVVARDDFGRMLAYVYLASDGTFVNLRIVRDGFAHTLSIAPNTAHAVEFARAAHLAQAANIGLWANCSG